MKLYKIENILLALLLLGLTSWVLLLPYSSEVSFTIELLLSITYLIFYPAILGQVEFRKILIRSSYKHLDSKSLYFSMALGIIFSLQVFGVFVYLHTFRRSDGIMLICLISLFLIFVIQRIFDFQVQNVSSAYKRIVAGIIIAVATIIVPKESIVSFTYSDYPDLKESIIALFKNPHNEELYEKYLLEKEKFKNR